MTDRLTRRDEFDNADIIGVESQDLAWSLEYDGLNLLTGALNRLAAYEDTGLMPEEVTQVNDFVGSQLHKAMELNALLLKELAEVTTEKNAAIRTRERVMNKLSKQVAHTVRARHLRDEARAEADRLRTELEAAKQDISRECDTCQFAECPASIPPCEMCGGYRGEYTGTPGWKWRGPCAENGGGPNE